MGDVVFRTSGSTGTAKEIVRREAELEADATALVAAFPELWSSRPTVVATAPVDHFYGYLWRFLTPRCAGCPVESETALSVEALVAAKVKYGRFLFVTTPSFLEKLLVHPDVSALAGAFAGLVTSGSALRSETALAAAGRLGVAPLEIYGSTETGTIAWRRQTDGEAYTLFRGVDAHAQADGRLIVDSPYAMARPFAMSDAVRFTAPRQFVFLGRVDRRVKILENFVSLPDVEAVLERHPGVRCARAETLEGDVPRVGALIVPSEEGVRRLLAGSQAEFACSLRRELLPMLGAAAFPRRIRFVRALPVDARGKTTSSAARAALAAWCREPTVVSWQESSDRLVARLFFSRDLECFDGHFPGLPILPGVAQLFFIRHFARQAFNDFPEAATYRRLKFQKIVSPGNSIVLTLNRLGAGKFEFTLDSPSGRCSSGMIERSSE